MNKNINNVFKPIDKSREDIFKPPKGQHKLMAFRDARAGAFYFLTICVYGKEDILFDEQISRIIFDSLDFMEKDEWIKLICCIIMPDHLHIVLHLLEKKSLAEILKSFKSFTSRRINRLLGRKGQLWQTQYYEHKIRQDEGLCNIVDYCHHNPLRRGLVDNPDEYPYWKLRPENIFE